MVSHVLTKRVVPFAKQFVRRGHDDSGIVGSNLPFGIKNKLLLVLGFTFYTASGLTLPFFMTYHSLRKNQ